MENPFHRRATEQLRDDEAFLSIVSPQPLTYFLKRPADRGTLYDRLVLFQGTPGSGKTTLARLFEYSALGTVLRSTGSTEYESVAGALEQCGAIKDGLPTVVGCRLPMETDYRDFWEFPYPESLRSGLLFTFIQARALLAWLRHLQAAGIAESDISIIPRSDSAAALEAIGGHSGASVAQKAREVERAVYDVVGALVAPKESDHRDYPFATWTGYPEPSIGYIAAIGHIVNPWHFRRTEKTLEQVYLHGMTKNEDPQADIMRLAWSWVAAPELQMPDAVKSSNGSTGEYLRFTYDQTQRSYIVPRKESGPTPVEFKFVSIYDDNYLHGTMWLVNPAIVVPNWNDSDVSITLKVNGVPLKNHSDYRFGFEQTKLGKDLVIWIKQTIDLTAIEDHQVVVSILPAVR